MESKYYVIDYDDNKSVVVEVQYEKSFDDRYGEDIDGRRGRTRINIDVVKVDFNVEDLSPEDKEFLKAEALANFRTDCIHGEV